MSNILGKFCFDVGQVGNLQPIVNRPFGAVTNRAQDAILPHIGLGNEVFVPGDRRPYEVAAALDSR